MTLRRLTHPGPVAGPRIETVPCRVEALHLRLRAGLPLNRAVAQALAEAGFAAGYLRLEGVALAPLVWVVPAPAPGDGRVAWFSAPHRMKAGRITLGGIHLGRDGTAPFGHCHGLWTGGDGQTGIGHLQGDDSILAADAVVSGWGIAGALLERRDDPETGFALFSPVALDLSAPNAALCRIRPNEDLVTALAGLDLGQARIEGLGSLVGARFESGASVEGDAAEFVIASGAVVANAVRLEIAATGMDGALRRGRLSVGLNAVCITAELLILPKS